MDIAHPALSFSSFLGAFPLTLMPCFMMMFIPALMGKPKSAFPRKSRAWMRYIIWLACWMCAFWIALEVRQSLHVWLHLEEKIMVDSSVSTLEAERLNNAQALHYHYSALAGLHQSQVFQYQMLYQNLWYSALFLVLPVFVFWNDRRQERLAASTLKPA